MPFTPNTITRATSRATTTPVMWGETPQVSCTSSEMELAFTVLPIPKAAMAVNTQNSMASHRMFNPRSKAYMGPPSISPSGFFTRYFMANSPSAYLVEMPSIPVSQHHNTAPGPPSETAVATPMIFPVPMVAANEVANAPNWLTSPLACLSVVTDRRMAVHILRWGTRKRMVKNR